MCGAFPKRPTGAWGYVCFAPPGRVGGEGIPAFVRAAFPRIRDPRAPTGRQLLSVGQASAASAALRKPQTIRLALKGRNCRRKPARPTTKTWTSSPPEAPRAQPYETFLRGRFFPHRARPPDAQKFSRDFSRAPANVSVCAISKRPFLPARRRRGAPAS